VKLICVTIRLVQNNNPILQPIGVLGEYIGWYKAYQMVYPDYS